MPTPLGKQLRHRKERIYGSIMLVIGAVLWLAILAVIAVTVMNGHPEIVLLYVFYAVLFVLLSLIGAAIYRAHAFGHYVLLGEQQFPHLHAMLCEGAAELGLAKVPVAFVYNSNGLLNAFARRLLGKPYVFLTSMLLDVDTDAQIRFVIGHELGHHAAGHLNPLRNLLKLPADFIPFLPQAYSRGRELTADRIGAHVAQDLAASRTALQMLACGSARLNSMLNPAAFAAQEAMVPGFFGWLIAILSRYPRTTQRVLALQDRTGSSMARRVEPTASRLPSGSGAPA